MKSLANPKQNGALNETSFCQSKSERSELSNNFRTQLLEMG